MRHTGLAARTALVTVAVAAITVLIAGVVSLGLVRGATRDQARRTLGRFAELAAAPTAGGGAAGGGAAPNARLRTGESALRRLQVSFVQVRTDGVATAGSRRLPADVVVAVRAGRPVDEVARIGGRQYLIEARPAGGASTPVLLQPTSTLGELTDPLVRRIGLALLLGVAVAVLAGTLLARRLARPLQAAAGAAHRMAAGERGVRIEPTGPTEVVEVAESLNALSGALAVSEGRQREFLLSVSHELRTPLTGIQGFAEALADGVVPAGEVAGAGATIRAESRHLERLVADLLDLARLGARNVRVEAAAVDLGVLLTGAAQVWARRCADVGVELRQEITAVTVITDPVRVRQIVDGLAENALRVTPAGAPVVLAVGPDPYGGAVVEVRDGGPGLTDDDLAVAFEQGVLYERYRAVRRVGTGVGLALVAALAARLDGRVEAGHAPEGGATFRVQLPPRPRESAG